MPTDSRRFLTIGDAAEILDVTPADITALLRSGALEGIRIGGAWRIEEAALETWIEDAREHERRSALWHEAQDSSIADLFGRRN